MCASALRQCVNMHQEPLAHHWTSQKLTFLRTDLLLAQHNIAHIQQPNLNNFKRMETCWLTVAHKTIAVPTAMLVYGTARASCFIAAAGHCHLYRVALFKTTGTQLVLYKAYDISHRSGLCSSLIHPLPQSNGVSFGIEKKCADTKCKAAGQVKLASIRRYRPSNFPSNT